ncbi:ABC transporter ATP-binding protein [Affinibrenneria salicis]|uniref:ABC transporter ATP-binding protein n=2 Tax=Affinibrenneria salicis TaxID=2590031 RepID=A0A5J5FR44_9GAMM|nr:ABC transporter ATP-binding protein [Affinibrenneria salicis]
MPVLDNLSLTARDNEIICLLGASGCGKTTLLKAVAGLQPVERGTIALAGRMVQQARYSLAPERRGVGMIFQDYALFPHLTVAGNIAFGLSDRSSSAVSAVLRRMLALVQLDGLADRYPHELSGGQQQRVAIARALACEPKLLLLDEPFSNIDSQVRYSLISALRQILKRQQVAALFVTHNKEEAFAFADRLAVMDNGRIVQIGSPAGLYRQPENRFVADFLGNSNYLRATIVSERRWTTALGEHVSAQPHGQPAGAQCDWLVRPQDITLVGDDGAGHGVIEDRLFMGTSNRYRIGLADGWLDVQSDGWLEPGQRVRLSVAARQPVFFASHTG